MEFPFHAVITSEAETKSIAEDFAKGLNGGEVIILNGELGAGKTYFVKKAISSFAITWVNSPSFAIVNEYKNSHKFYHIDFYRIKSVQELFDIGFDDYLNDNHAIVFIEWGNLFPQILPRKRIEIDIRILLSNNRELTVMKYV